MSSTNHCWGTQFSRHASVYAFRGQWIAGLETTTMPRHFQDERQRGRQLARAPGDHRRHSCPDLLRVPPVGGNGGANTTASSRGRAVRDGAGVVGSVRFSSMVEVPEAAKAAAALAMHDFAANAANTEEKEEADKRRPTIYQGPINGDRRRAENLSDASDSSENADVVEAFHVDSGSGGSSTGSGTLSLVPSSTPRASCNGDSQKKGDQETLPTIGNSRVSGAAETCGSSVSSSSSSASSSPSSSSSCTSSSSSFFTGGAGVGGVDMSDLIEPLEVDQTAASVASVSPSGEEASVSCSSEDTGCVQTKTRRAGRGRRPSSLLAEQQQQQKQKQQQQCVEDFPGRGIRMAGCRIVRSAGSVESSSTLLVGASESHALDDRQQQLPSRSDSNQELWGYWSGGSQSGGCRSPSRDSSVSTASYGDEESSNRYYISLPNDHQTGGTAASPPPPQDPWLSLQGYIPVPRGRDGEESSAGPAVDTGPSAVPPQQNGRGALRDITLQNSPVVKVVDKHVGQPFDTPARVATSGGGGEGSGLKRTPEELAYLRRAGIENFDSNASSVENVFIGTALRLAAMKSVSTKTAAEGEESPPSTAAPGSRAAPIVGASRSSSASAERAPSPSPPAPKDNVSFLYSWPGGQDAPPSGPFFGVAEVVGGSDANDGVYHGGEDRGSVGSPEAPRGEIAPDEESAVSQDLDNRGCHGDRCSYIGNHGGSDNAGSSRSLGGGRRAGGGSRRGSSSTYHQEGGVWIDVDGTPMGRIPPPQTALAGSLQQQHSRNRGLRPLKKSISEAGGLGSYLEGASSAHVSAIAAAEISRAAVAGALDTIWGCLEVQPSPRVQQPPPPPLSPSYSYVRPKALSLWGGVQLTE